MKRTVTVLFLLTWMLVSVTAQEVTKGSIEGSVSVAGTAEPLQDARITVLLLDGSGDTARVTFETPALPVAYTGRSGEFQLKELAPGSYRLSVLANGYARDDSGASIVVGPGQSVRGIRVQLRAAGTVSGRVHDLSGQPVADASVMLFLRTYSATGLVSFTQAATTRTNDLGEYRLYWVSPGRYAVAAELAMGLVLQSAPGTTFGQEVQRGNNVVREPYLRSYFPGVSDQTQAALIDVGSGAEARGIDFKLSPTRKFRIRGRVVDLATGQSPSQASIFLLTASGGGGSAGSWYDPRTGSIKIDDVAPGNYTLTASSGPMIGTRPRPTTPYAAASVVVRDADVEDLVLTLVQPPLIRGRIKLEGELPPSVRMNTLRVSLSRMDLPPASVPPSSNYSATAAEDGTFILSAASEGEFRVTITPVPNGLYLKEARLDGRDVLVTPAKFSSAGELELVVSSRGGIVEGTVQDAQGRALGAIQTVLIPDGQRDRPELFRRVLTDRNGKFSMAGVAPGTYRLFAWEGLEAYEYFDPQILVKYEAQGKPLRVSENSAQTIDLLAIVAGAP